jgi:hypothetical protein
MKDIGVRCSMGKSRLVGRIRNHQCFGYLEILKSNIC